MDYPNYIEYEKLEECHPEVEMNSEMYDNIDILLEGGARLEKHIEKFLVKKPDEDKEIYSFRKKIFTYEPILGQCVAQLLNRMCVSNYIVEGLPQEGDEAEFWEYFRENIDGQGLKEKDFLKDVFMTLLKYRKAFILVDKPFVDDEVNSLRDEKELGITPYSVVYGGNIVTHYHEVDGKLQWVKLRKMVWEYSPVEDTKCFIEYTFIDKDTMAQYKVEVDIDDNGCYHPTKEYLDESTEEVVVPLVQVMEHGRGEVPIIKIELPHNLYVAKEAYYLCLEHIRVHNNLSYTSVVAGQIQRLFRPIKEGSDTMVDMNAAKLQTGNDRVLIGESFSYNETTGSAITTVSTYMARLEARIKDIIFSNGLSNDTDRPMQESGVAKSMDFIAQEQALQSYGEKLIDSLETLYRMVAKIRPQSEEYVRDISVSGMNEFVLDSVDAKINRMIQLDTLEAELAPTVNKLVVEDLQRALTPYASSKEQALIKEETDKKFDDANDFPELETNEIISLVQNQLLSNSTAQEILGFQPDQEKERVETQMLDMAETENEIAGIMGAGENTEGEGGIPGDNQAPVDPSTAVALAEVLAQKSGVTVDEILNTVGFNEQLAPEEMNSIVRVLAEQISELTGAPTEEILAQVQ